MKWGIGNVKGSGGASNTMLTTTTDATENSGTYTLDLTYLSETPKVNDYVAYVNSGAITTLYKVSAIGSTNATLEKIGDIGGGGGKQLYQHNIVFGGASKARVNIIIENEQSTAMDMADILAYFTQKGVSNTNKYPAYGQMAFIEGAGCLLAQYVYQDSTFERLKVEGFNTTNGNADTSLINPASSGYTINDYVIAK